MMNGRATGACLRLLTALILVPFVSGCAYRVRSFNDPDRQKTFENWRISVHVEARPIQPWESGKDTSENHMYQIYSHASTWDRKVYRESTYSARFDSLEITYLQEGQVVKVPLDDLRPPNYDHPYAMVLHQLSRVSIPRHVRRLQAITTITFTDKQTGERETVRFEFQMRKFDGLKPDLMAPLLM